MNAVNEPALDDTPGEDPTVAPVIAATEERQDCDVSTPTLAYQGDPTAFGRYDPFAGDLFQGIAPVIPGPQFVAPQEASGTTTLRWGSVNSPAPGASKYAWVGWGWLHISAKHGWTASDAQATQTTLIQAQYYVNRNGRHVYRAPASAAYAGRTGQPCIRVVVVEPNVQPGETYLGQPAPAPGIWTSYGQPTTFPLV